MTNTVGDSVLQNVAETISSGVRKTDTVIRYGGDEFIIIFYRIPADVFKKKLEDIRHAVDMLVIDEYPEIHLTVSIGGVYGTGRTKELFKTADSLMYQAKTTKNQVKTRFLGFETEDNKKENGIAREEQHQ